MKKNDHFEESRKLVLASKSNARRSILAGLRLVFEIIAPDFEETRQPDLPAEQIAIANAKGKACAVDAALVAKMHRPALVIGSDQVCCTESGLILHKPGSVDKAVDQLTQASNQWLTFCTSLALVMDGKVHKSTVEHCVVKIRTLTESEIRAYVAADNPLWSAGSFHAEGAGLRLIEKIETTDINVLYGLPALTLLRFLRELEFPLAYR